MGHKHLGKRPKAILAVGGKGKAGRKISMEGRLGQGRRQASEELPQNLTAKAAPSQGVARGAQVRVSCFLLKFLALTRGTKKFIPMLRSKLLKRGSRTGGCLERVASLEVREPKRSGQGAGACILHLLSVPQVLSLSTLKFSHCLNLLIDLCLSSLSCKMGIMMPALQDMRITRVDG